MAFPKPITIILTPIEIRRFWSYVDKTPGQGPQGNCWEWRKTKPNKAGHMQVRSNRLNAPRVSYLLRHKVDPFPLFICHRCDNPPCVNPEHLFTDTAKGNSEDMVRKGRAAYGQRNGKFTHPEKTPRGENHGARKNPQAMARGSKNGNSKLTEQLVMQIREMYASGTYSSRAIGHIVDLDKSTVLDIVSGRIWKHLPLIPSSVVSSLAQLPAGSRYRRASNDVKGE